LGEIQLEIIFIRHGESEANVKNIFSNTGYKHGLTDRGIMQVESLVERLKNSYSSFDEIYCSPLRRAVETAGILGKNIGIKPEIDSRLIEFSVGELEGESDSKSWILFMNLWREWFENDNHDASLPGGESLSQIIHRLRKFLDYVILRPLDTSNMRIITVSHGGVLMSSLPFLVSNLNTDFRKLFQMNPTDYINVKITNSEILLISNRCTKRK
jgi:broad specificity phosphatase PhoE